MTPKFRSVLAAPGLGLMATFLSTTAFADVPSVATDITPVHSLVSIVMGDLGTPALIVQPGASPHGYSMRPSEAQALDRADLVVWMGEALTPWLEGPIDTLASGAHKIELMSVEGTVLHDYREGATFAAHDHDHDEHDAHSHDDHKGHDHEEHDHSHDGHDDHDGHDGHDHDKHDDHAEKAGSHDHDHDHDHDEKAESHDHGHGHDDHDHSGADSHAWLDPVNARLWLGVIAQELAELDPDNAATYAANAAAGQADLETLEATLTAELSTLGDTGFVVFHDAYQYFERRFGLSASGAISMSDASAPSAGRIAELQTAVSEMGAICVFAEPQFNRALVDSVFAGTTTVGMLDPLGFDLEPGPALYGQILRNMGTEFATCLTR
jgi:zinc transport system substrate-binding protein